MSEFKGTPGPWVYAPNDPVYGQMSPYYVWTSKGPGYGTVASTTSAGLMPTEPDKQAANAQLIAAAPDLLAACIVAIASDSFVRLNPAAQKMIREAITKALGQ